MHGEVGLVMAGILKVVAFYSVSLGNVSQDSLGYK